MNTPEPIAIVGIGCRFPGAPNPAAYWRLLREGQGAIREVPADRWDVDAYYDPDPAAPGKMSTRWGGFLEQVDRFDPQFFRIAPREATHIDPQQRLLLELAWEALEDAGHPADALTGSRTGVFVGVSSYDYGMQQLLDPGLSDAYVGTGSALSIAANRVSYAFDLRGPSLALDTACSSSLVAVNLACQSLRSGDCNLALAGGVSLMVSPAVTINFSKAGFMSPDGLCKTFDARANGYVRGEGAGLVVLKPLARALADNDPIYAVVRGGAVNQDGRTNGLTAPNRYSQEAVLREAYERAGVSPSAVAYVEAHGTGTALGDVMEAQALGAVVGAGRSDSLPCAIGSVKSNFGHLEAAAGIAGVIKVALALKHGQIPSSLNFEQPNPQIAFEALGLQVQTQTGPWPDLEGPAIAGVSSFGFGGTNAHIVLEAHASGAGALGAIPLGGGAQAQLVPLSARNPAALQALARDYHAFLSTSENETTLPDVAYTVGTRRAHMDHRLAVVAHSTSELVQGLEAFLTDEARPGVASGGKIPVRRPKVAFVFPGQGSQWLGMGRHLLAHEPVFREALQACDRAFRRFVDWSLMELLADDAAGDRLLEEIGTVQPVLFAIEVGLASLWRSWGVTPDAVVGHSMGEVAAAHVAGILSIEDAASVICQRSDLLRRTSGQGRMAMVDLPLAEAQKALEPNADRVSVAASNSYRSTVLSGDPAALDEIMTTLQARDIFCRLVKVDVASHSPQMDPLRDDLLRALKGLEPQPAATPMYSTVTGAVLNGSAGQPPLDAAYWVQNLRQPVLFADAVQRLLESGHTLFIELSPHPILVSAVQQTAQHLGRDALALPSLRRDEHDERAVMLGSLGEMYSRGAAVDWCALQTAPARCVPLPPYPWQRERYWAEFAVKDEPVAAAHPATREAHPFLSRRVAPTATEGGKTWETELDSQRFPFLRDHLARGEVIVSGTTLLEFALAAMAAEAGPLTEGTCTVLKDVRIRRALSLPDGSTRTVQVMLTPREGGRSEFLVRSRPVGRTESAWETHATGVVLREPMEGTVPALNLQEVQARCSETVIGADFYPAVDASGVTYGPTYQGILQLWRSDGESLAEAQSPEDVEVERGAFQFHPALLDLAGQALLGTTRVEESVGVHVPVEVAEIRVYAGPTARMWAHARRSTASDAGRFDGDSRLFDADGRLLAEVQGLRWLALEQVRAAEHLDDWLYVPRWVRSAQDAKTMEQVAGRTWLVFDDGSEVGRGLVDRLEARGARVVTAAVAPVYQRVSPNHYEVDPTRPEDFQYLLADVFGSADDGQEGRGIVYLWGRVEPVAEDEAVPRLLEAAEVAGYGGVLHLVQALARLEIHAAGTPRLWLVTAGVQSAGGSIVASTATVQAPLWGLGRTIGLEHPELRCSCVDLSSDDSDGAELDGLLREILADGREQQVALRGGERFVSRLTHSSAVRERSSALVLARGDATYLITGGLGGLGLEVAKWLVQQGARSLVLAGRSEPSAAAASAIEGLRGAGARVVVGLLDVADREQVAALFASMRRSLPPLRGLVHAAGVLDDGVLLQLNLERFRTVMAAKVAGAWNLHAQLQSLDAATLDFFVLFSSAAALFGSTGQGNYAAANAYLDALAHHRRARGQPALSIAWGPWSQVGLAARPERGDRLGLAGMGSLSPAQGIQALAGLMSGPSNLVQPAVLPVDWPTFRAEFPTLDASPFLAEIQERVPGGGAQAPAEAGGASELARRLAATPGPRRREVLVEHLREQLASILRLGKQSIDPHVEFADLGMDSLMGVDLKTRLQSSLGRPLPLTLTLDYRTIAALADYLVSTLPSETGTSASSADRNDEQVDSPDAALLARVVQMSDEEVVAAIEEKVALLMRVSGRA